MSKEIPLSMAAAGAIMAPKGTMGAIAGAGEAIVDGTINAVNNTLDYVGINTTATSGISIGATNGLFMPIASALGTAKLTGKGLDVMGVQNRFGRFGVMTAAVAGVLSSPTLAPIAAAGTTAYYGGKGLIWTGKMLGKGVNNLWHKGYPKNVAA